MRIADPINFVTFRRRTNGLRTDSRIESGNGFIGQLEADEILLSKPRAGQRAAPIGTRLHARFAKIEGGPTGGPHDVDAPPRNMVFGRIAILVLAAQWIVFGSMHFSDIEATIAQIPKWIPLKFEIAIVTGIAEVATGILILVPALRKWAALSSLVLLILLSPAMYEIVTNPAATASLGAWAMPFRIILLPNNIFLAICAIYLWRHPDASLTRPSP